MFSLWIWKKIWHSANQYGSSCCSQSSHQLIRLSDWITKATMPVLAITFHPLYENSTCNSKWWTDQYMAMISNTKTDKIQVSRQRKVTNNFEATHSSKQSTHQVNKLQTTSFATKQTIRNQVIQCNLNNFNSCQRIDISM